MTTQRPPRKPWRAKAHAPPGTSGSPAPLVQGRPAHPYNLRNAVTEFERKYVRNVLEIVGWDVADAAEILGMTVQQVQDILQSDHTKQRKQQEL